MAQRLIRQNICRQQYEDPHNEVICLREAEPPAGGSELQYLSSSSSDTKHFMRWTVLFPMFSRFLLRNHFHFHLCNCLNSFSSKKITAFGRKAASKHTNTHTNKRHLHFSFFPSDSLWLYSLRVSERQPAMSAVYSRNWWLNTTCTFSQPTVLNVVNSVRQRRRAKEKVPPIPPQRAPSLYFVV